MAVPLISKDKIWGYMGIDLVDRTRMWTNEDYQWFSSLANVISICIELRKTKDEAVRERTFLSNLFRYMPLGYVRMSIVCDEKDNPYGYYVTDEFYLCRFSGKTRVDVYRQDCLVFFKGGGPQTRISA